MNKKTLAIFVVSMVLVCALSIMGTIAYLTGKSETVTNTFISGNVTISLDEAEMNAEGTALVVPAARTSEGNSYKMIPGTKYTKDPTITIEDGSENCYIGAIITVANADLLPDDFAVALDTFGIELEQGWSVVKTTEVKDGETVTAWQFAVVYDELCEVADEVVIFDAITIPDFTNEELATAIGDAEQVKIDVTGYAVQATGFESEAAPAKAALAGGFPEFANA